MLRNHFKIAWRNLIKNKSVSFISILGLSAGMSVALLIALWVYDELSFDKDNQHYNTIAQVMQHQKLSDEMVTWKGLPFPLANTLRNNYKSDFKNIALVNWGNSLLSVDQKNMYKNGMYAEPQAPELFDIKMRKGRYEDLQKPDVIFLSAVAENAFFGSEDAMNKTITIEGLPVTIGGVYEDMPDNSTLAGIQFIAPWQLRLVMLPWIKNMDNAWGNNAFEIFVQVADHADMVAVSHKIKNAKLDNIREEEKKAGASLFLQPMRKWHLYSEFKNGINTGGAIAFVRLFSIIGIFVLMLACINFMNLSTARSEKRAKEVGVRKAAGSSRKNLVRQFLTESLLVAFIAMIISIFITQSALPFFNSIAGKHINIVWQSPVFWALLVAFTLCTGLISGSYPAFYLSSFTPAKTLKGVFKAGKMASLPRKVLVVAQFAISVILIIGTIVVFRQIQVAKNRPVGYSRDGLLSVELHNSDIHKHFETIRNELKSNGAIAEMAESGSPVTSVWNSNTGMSWKGKVPGSFNDLPMSTVSWDYGKTVNWKITAGRDFSRSFPSDSSAFILNEAAVKFMGFKNPIGEQVTFDDGVAFTVIGVVKDFVVESPYALVRPYLFRMIRSNGWGIVNIRLNPVLSAHEALQKVGSVFKKFSPDQPFEYKFVDEAYAAKFGNEERIGNLATVFASLAIFISCLGLFGLASFVAEQRTKEIGIRKVLGASAWNVWKLLSSEFVQLVLIALLVAIPLGYYVMSNWLLQYSYRAPLSWWIFGVTGAGAIIITVITVSIQSIKAALANPVKSLRTE